MGILVNGGVRKPTQRIDSLHFAKDTPYETLVKRGDAEKSERVLNPDVARAVVNAIRGVVQDGTAKRAKTAFVKDDGSVIALGGKTGTGDQRFDVYGAGHRLIESRYVNRSATFVFNIGERFFGSMTAYVHGPDSAHYDFTSALPVQLLVKLAPSLMPMIQQKDTVTIPGLHVERAAPAPAGPTDAVARDTEQPVPADAAPVEAPAAAEPVAKPAAKADKPAEKPAVKAAEKPAEKVADKPVDKPADKPAAKKPALDAAGDHPKAVAPRKADEPKPAPRKPAAKPDADAPPPKPAVPKPAAVEEVLQ
jgi:membrane peptidoglycan carboxypeptidase